MLEFTMPVKLISSPFGIFIWEGGGGEKLKILSKIPRVSVVVSVVYGVTENNNDTPDAG